MLAVADLLPLTVDLPKEFRGPFDYSGRWVWLALGALALVALYYALALWFTRTPPPPPPPPVPLPPDTRSRHLARIDAIEASVREGRTSLREGHQQLSEVVRSYVEEITPLSATRMTLADFRLRAPRPLTQIIEVVYPPEFAPDGEAQPAERFAEALRQARGLVSTWRR
ncbi:hypothetical protein [Nocardioides montaniterrae]